MTEEKAEERWPRRKHAFGAWCYLQGNAEGSKAQVFMGLYACWGRNLLILSLSCPCFYK